MTMTSYFCKIYISLVLLAAAFSSPAHAQFVDNFDGPTVALDPEGNHGWLFLAGDGTATMDLRQGGPGYASVFVDATTDKRGIWWTLIERKLNGKLDLSLLKTPSYEVRIEARVKSSHAPRRINLQLATQRTTDDYSQLMEYDIPTANTWYTFSLTTNHFDAVPGDTVIAHLALMDWGLEKYQLDIDYIKVDVVNVSNVGPDKGEAVPYHPPVADDKKFHQVVPVAQDIRTNLTVTDRHGLTVKLEQIPDCAHEPPPNYTAHQLAAIRFVLNQLDYPDKDQELVGHPDPLIVGPPSVVASDAGELLPS
jgi:hypothetical protein